MSRHERTQRVELNFEALICCFGCDFVNDCHNGCSVGVDYHFSAGHLMVGAAQSDHLGPANLQLTWPRPASLLSQLPALLAYDPISPCRYTDRRGVAHVQALGPENCRQSMAKLGTLQQSPTENTRTGTPYLPGPKTLRTHMNGILQVRLEQLWIFGFNPAQLYASPCDYYTPSIWMGVISGSAIRLLQQSQGRMDRSFNFFKTKIKKENAGPRNTSKSNSSKASHQKFNDKPKPNILKPAVLTKREVEIRQAIEHRFDRSKIRAFQFSRLDERGQPPRKRSNSNQMLEFRNLRNKNIFDLKAYHTRPQTPSGSPHSSQDSKKFNLRFKMRDSASGGITKTEGHESTEKHPYLNRIIKNITPSSRLTNKGDEWKFISIQLKEDHSRAKTRKTEVKISSHRAYNFNQPREKPKCNSAYGKYAGKMQEMARQSHSRF